MSWELVLQSQQIAAVIFGIGFGLVQLSVSGNVPLDMYEQIYRGATMLCWRKTRRYGEEQGEGWPGLFEWVQWLAERMEERPSRPRPNGVTA